MKQNMSDLRIEQWPVERLVPYAKNARTLSDGQVAQVAASIAEFGSVNPILVGPDRGSREAPGGPQARNE